MCDGVFGLSGFGGFKVEFGCYYLFVFYVCFWVYWMMIFCKLKGLEDYIILLVVEVLMLENGWEFKELELVIGVSYVWNIYVKVDFEYIGWVIVLILWDKV